MTQGQNNKRHPSAIGGARNLIRSIGRTAMVQAYEVALMASFAATAPLHLLVGADSVRDAQLQVRAHTASTARPVLLVHGLGGSSASWTFVAQALTARGLTVEALTYGPFGTSVEQLADRLVIEVQRILNRTCADKLHLVGHSLGGVVIAQALAGGRLNGQIDTVVTLGSPFGGSPWAHILPFGAIARALRDGSPLLRRLASTPLPDGVRWLAFTASLDMVVPGLRSMPTHAQVESVMVDGVGHLGMLLSREVVSRIAAALPTGRYVQICG